MAAASSANDQVTVADAMSNTAFRNALLTNVQIQQALSPSVMEKIGVHLLGMSLSFCAGCVNAIGFCKFNTYVSHVTGVSSSIGLRVEGDQEGDAPSAAEIIIFFTLGSILAGLLIPKNTLKMGQARYDVVLILVAAMEFLSWCHSMTYPQVLAAAMGLQNAMASNWSGNVLRTTHMTGTATDLGTAAGRIVSRFFRKGCCPSSYTEQDWDEHVVDRQKFVLLTLLLACFILGGLAGTMSYNELELHALLLPAGITACLGTNHLVYCLAKWEPLQEQIKQEQVFTRQISEAMANEAPGHGHGVPNNDRLEEFIRQLSNPDAQASGSGDKQPLLKP